MSPFIRFTNAFDLSSTQQKTFSEKKKAKNEFFSRPTHLRHEHPLLAVQVRRRLVQQEHVRGGAPPQAGRDRHPLELAPGEGAKLAGLEGLRMKMKEYLICILGSKSMENAETSELKKEYKMQPFTKMVRNVLLAISFGDVKLRRV